MRDLHSFRRESVKRDSSQGPRRAAFCAGVLLGTLVLVLGLGTQSGTRGGEPQPTRQGNVPNFDALLQKHRDAEYPDVLQKVGKPRRYLARPSSDPTRAEYFHLVRKHFEMTPEEVELFRKNGFISLDIKLLHTFASAYQQIYAADLPVMVTTDSVLHALHVSYDQILLQLEAGWFTETIGEVLEACQKRVIERGRANADAVLAENYRDVDLYLAIARSLLAGAGAPVKGEPHPGINVNPVDRQKDEWTGGLPVATGLGQDADAESRLKDIQSLVLQVPDLTRPTTIYGGSRYVDYSQFAPRGHYAASTSLSRYFRCLMWLGRADCGWNLSATDNPALQIDADRELRDAALLAEVVRETGSLFRLKAMNDVLNLMVGRGDNLTPFGLLDVMDSQSIRSVVELRDARKLARLRSAIGTRARQQIRSQVLKRPSSDPDTKAEPPELFQFFGQRFTLDSFVLSQVVHDAILFQGERMRRMMPTGLDVMAALGNDEAVPLLETELTKWKYGANLLACREFVAQQPPSIWRANLYSVWVSALRTLDEDVTGVQNMPEAFRTRAWQYKQLQAQLGSWAELRHDTILYAKQSYSIPACEYPAGYVEPYPEFFATLQSFADQARSLFEANRPSSPNAERRGSIEFMRQRQVAFFAKMAGILGRLRIIAQKERDGEPFTADEKDFLKAIVNARRAGSGPPRYDGWYGDLFYQPGAAPRWDPVVADVHTDVQNEQALEVAVGNANFGIVAVEREGQSVAYVGPLFSYYEFNQPVGQRLTDQAWQERITEGSLPSRPDWIKGFQAPARALKQFPKAPGGQPFKLPIRF